MKKNREAEQNDQRFPSASPPSPLHYHPQEGRPPKDQPGAHGKKHMRQRQSPPPPLSHPTRRQRANTQPALSHPKRRQRPNTRPPLSHPEGSPQGTQPRRRDKPQEEQNQKHKTGAKGEEAHGQEGVEEGDQEEEEEEED